MTELRDYETFLNHILHVKIYTTQVVLSKPVGAPEALYGSDTTGSLQPQQRTAFHSCPCGR